MGEGRTEGACSAAAAESPAGERRTEGGGACSAAESPAGERRTEFYDNYDNVLFGPIHTLWYCIVVPIVVLRSGTNSGTA